MEALLNDPSKIAQILFYALFGFVTVIGILTGKKLKKNPPKLPVELHLAPEITEDIKAIRQASESTEKHTAKIASALNGEKKPTTGEVDKIIEGLANP